MVKVITVFSVMVGIIVGGISIIEAINGQPNPFLEMTEAIVELAKKAATLIDRCLQDCNFEGN